MKDNALLFGTLFDQPSLFTRLKEEFAEAGREFRTSPRAFVAATIKGNAMGGARRRMLLKFGIATGIVVYAILFAAILIFWTVAHRFQEVNETQGNPPPTKFVWTGSRPVLDGPEDQKDSHGGGGGGRETPTLASDGVPPISSFAEQLIAPTPEPQVKAPILPVAEIIPVDSRFNLRPDDAAPTGLPGGVIGPPSPGPGSGRGMGDGKEGGIGSGKGKGLFEGEGWNIGKGPGGIGGRPHSYTSEVQQVDEGPVALNRPRPNYTEEARKEKIQGVILARALVGADGTVRQVVIRRSLPGGLDGEAIRAVSQMRFKPAMRSGQPVATWITLEVEFNLR